MTSTKIKEVLIASSTSPSVYVIYTGLSADEYCYSGLWEYDSYTNGSYVNGSWSNVSRFYSRFGSTHARVTRAYAPEALSTGGDCFGTRWAAINYTKLYSPEPDYEIITGAACSRQGYRVSKGEVTEASYFLAGDPLLSMPQDLSLVDPLWSTCRAERAGGYDPPVALTVATALVPDPTTTSDPLTQAEPASSPTHYLPVQTSTPNSDAPVGDKPPANDPGLDPPDASIDQNPSSEKALAPTPNSNIGPDPYPSNQGKQGDPVAPSPQQNSGQKDVPAIVAPNESNTQEEDLPPIPDPAQQQGGSNFPSTLDSYEESDIPSKGAPVVDSQEARIVVGTHTILVAASGTSFDGATLNPEGSPVTVSGTAAMMKGSNIVIGDAIVHLPSSAADGPTLIAGHMVTPLAGAVAIDGQTLHAGDSGRTIAGTGISLNDNDDLIVNPTIQTLPTPPPPSVETLIDGQTTNIDGQAAQVLSNGISIAGMILTPGGPAVTVSGTPISLDRTALMIDGSTIPVSIASQSSFTTTIDGQVIVAAPSSVVLQGISLEPGGPGITIDNKIVSLNNAGSLILDSSTIALSGGRLTTRIGDEMITAAPTGVQVAGNTLLPGAAGWTIDGTKVSLNGEGDVIIGGETIMPGGANGGIGGLILAGLGSKGSAATTSPSSNGEEESFRGAAVEKREVRGLRIAAAAITAVLLVESL